MSEQSSPSHSTNPGTAIASGTGGQILVVDDHSTNRLKLSKAVNKLGHEVLTANDGIPALDILRGTTVDLVLLDIDMPGMNGYEVLEVMKADDALQTIPVIVISAVDEMENIVKAIKLGAQDFLPKNFDPVLLEARIGACLEQKRLRDATASMMARMEKELEDASRAQLDMVPHEFPSGDDSKATDIYGYMQPAREVGGDFYDFFNIGDQTLWFVIGDVSDKGVAAGMFMARTAALVRIIPSQIFSHVGKQLTPEDVLATLNEQLIQFNPAMNFVTMILGRLDHKSGELLLANAGHETPQLLRAEGNCSPISTTRCRPVGIRADSKYVNNTLTLGRGELLFAYTDGVSDATNQSKESFSAERVVEALETVNDLNPSNVVNRMRMCIADFTQNEPQFDDITMLAVMR